MLNSNRNRTWLITAVLVAAAIFQIYLVMASYGWTWAKATLRTTNLPAMERSSRFLFGTEGSDNIDFLRAVVPDDMPVVGPEGVGGYGHQNLLQIFLLPRAIPGGPCMCAGDISPACTEFLLARSHYVPALGEFPASSIMEDQKELIEFDGPSGWFQGVYVPTGSSTTVSVAPQYTSISDWIRYSATSLPIYGLVFVAGFAVVAPLIGRKPYGWVLAVAFPVGSGLDARQLLGKPVWVGNDRLPGVIGGKPIHLATRDELKQTVKVESMAIDIGVSKKETAEGNVNVGTVATFETPFRRIRGTVRGKALDDRLGVTVLAELLEHPPEGIELQAAFTVQEEVGLRGARIAAHALQPDMAIALDCTPANDLPTWDGEENTQYNARLGLGPVIYAADSRTLAHPGLLQHQVDTSEAAEIPYQIPQPGGGGTDAGAIHLARDGIPSISVSVPARSIHAVSSIATVSDWRNTIRLVHAAISTLSRSVLR